MPLTDAQICNVALSRIGHQQPIAGLTETSTAASTCAIVYPLARDALLQSAPWSFATRRATLALVASVTRTGWLYVYALPADFIAVRGLWPGTRAPSQAMVVPYSLEYESTTAARVLLTDSEDALLTYTSAMVGGEALFPPLFCEALAWRVAVDLALTMPVKPQVAALMQRSFLMALQHAMATDLNQQQPDVPPDSELVTVRY